MKRILLVTVVVLALLAGLSVPVVYAQVGGEPTPADFWQRAHAAMQAFISSSVVGGALFTLGLILRKWKGFPNVFVPRAVGVMALVADFVLVLKHIFGALGVPMATTMLPDPVAMAGLFTSLSGVLHALGAAVLLPAVAAAQGAVNRWLWEKFGKHAALPQDTAGFGGF